MFLVKIWKYKNKHDNNRCLTYIPYCHLYDCDNLPDSQISKSPGIDIKSSEFKGPKPN